MLQRRAPPSVAFAAFLGAAIIGGGTLAADAAGPVKQTVEIDLTLWPLRDIASVRDDPFGVLVKYGCTLFTDTANQIGRPRQTRRFAGRRPTMSPSTS
jgi:cytochrome c